MKKPPFLNNHIYHIMNRGVEKRDIFLDSSDYSYMIHNLFVLNDQKPSLNTSRDFILKNSPQSLLMEVGLPSIEIEGVTTQDNAQNTPREPLVEILAFVLMSNHFHLMLRQLVDGGIIKFMQKLGTSTTKRFNIKNDRVGPLFQGRFKAVLIEGEAQLMYLPNYIHLNPLKIINKINGSHVDGSIDGSPTSINRERVDILANYKWSSLPDYLGKKNFPSVTQRDFLLDIFGGIDGYRNDISGFLQQNNEKIDEGIYPVLLK